MLGVNLLTTLVTSYLDRLGDMNPQVLREFKGRLKRFPMMAAIGLSVLCQIVVMISFWAALPGSVMLKDMRLTTYPRIEWRAETHLSPQPMQDLLPLDLTNRDLAAKSGVIAEHIDAPDPLRGDKRLGLEALDRIQPNDRLIKVDGELITTTEHQPSEPDFPHSVESELRDTVNQKVLGRASYGSLTAQEQALIGTTVELEFYNTEQGYYTVTLPRVAISRKQNPYCVSTGNGLIRRYNSPCHITQDKQSYLVNWPRWYSHIYTCLSILIVFPLMGIGVFMLANNLAEEKRRGTLNFLRLSPRSAFTILSGKLLGVPICLYLAVGLLFPLHWFAGLNAGYSLVQLLGFDLTLISQTLIVYLGAMLLSLSVSHPMVLGLQPWLLAAGVIGFNWILLAYTTSGDVVHQTDPNVLLWSLLFSPFSSLAYFTFGQGPAIPTVNLALGDFRVNFIEYVTLALVHAMGWCALLGHGLERRFGNSETTLLKRRFSYLVTLVVATIMVGLTGTRVKEHDVLFHLVLIMGLGVIYSIGLMVTLFPSRQTLKDWTRFRHAKPRHERRSLWNDLVVGDTSSPVVAIALNLILLTSPIVIAFSPYYSKLLPNRTAELIFVCCILMFIGSILFSTLARQIFLMLPKKRNRIWQGVVGSISCLAFPAISLTMGLFLLGPRYSPTHVLGMPSELAILVLPLSLLSTLTTILGIVHTQQLIRSGRSESQKLLSQV